MMLLSLIRIRDTSIKMTGRLTFGSVLLMSMAIPSVSTAEVDSGLLGHWEFDESSWAGDCLTADIVDSSGNGRHGIACIDGDAPVPVPGRFGNAALFDGVYQYANMGPGFNFTSSFSVTMWMALDDYRSCGPYQAGQHIIGTHHLPTPAGNGRGWGLYWDCDGLAWELTDSVGSAIESYGYVYPSPFPTNGSWHHLALVYDSTVPSATLYWDAVSVYSESGVENVPSLLYDNGEPLCVNGLPYAPGAGAPGKIDDTRVYDRALSPNEIQQIRTGVEAEDHPARFFLAQNVPNPFNPTTQIRFSLPQRSPVNIAVYNVAGQRVAILANRVYPAGEHSVRWNPRKLSSGVYYYQLTTREFTETRSMVLLK